MKKKIFSTTFFVIGFIFVFGSVGAIECNTIPFDQFIIQTCVGFVFMFGGIAYGVSM